MRRAFVIVGETRSVMANYCNYFLEINELVVGRTFWRALRSRPIPAENRIKRILREHVFDVGDKQFLMLLRVINAENENKLDFFVMVFVSIGKQIVNVRIE